MFKEFKAFALKGNLIDIAVGLILALAFAGLVLAFVEDLMMPLVAMVVGEPNFDGIVWTIGDTDILIGAFLTELVNFLLIAGVLFMIVKAVSRMQKPAEAAGPSEIELLTEIRDSLKNRSA